MGLRRARNNDPIELNMTAMIDIVFQLLIFFIMTLNIVTPEGDFNIKMPLSAPASGQIDPTLSQTIKLTISADGGGTIAGMRMGENPVSDFNELRARILSTVQAAGGPGKADIEVELDCDPQLHYEYVVKAITAVSGRIQDKQVQQLVGKIKFAPPKK